MFTLLPPATLALSCKVASVRRRLLLSESLLADPTRSADVRCVLVTRERAAVTRAVSHRGSVRVPRKSLGAAPEASGCRGSCRSSSSRSTAADDDSISPIERLRKLASELRPEVTAMRKARKVRRKSEASRSEHAEQKAWASIVKFAETLTYTV